MAEQQKQTTNDFAMSDLFSENGLAVLNDASEKRQWKKSLEESEAKVAALENKNLKIMEAKGVLEGKISSVRIFIGGHLKDFPLTTETAGIFKNVLRMLDPDPDEFTTKVHSAQQAMTPDPRDALSSSVAAGSSLGDSNTGAQIYLNTPVTGNKRRQVSVLSKASQKKVRREERLGSSTSDGDEDLDEYLSATRIQMAVESFFKSLMKNINFDDDDSKVAIEEICGKLKIDAVALKLAISCIKEDLFVLADPLKDIVENYYARIRNNSIKSGSQILGLVKNPSYVAWRVTCEKIKETPGIGEKAVKVMEIISFLAAGNIPTQFVLDLYDSIKNRDITTAHNTAIGENIFQLLHRFSFINFGSGESISVHPFIQKANRNDLEEQKRFDEVLGKIQRGAHEMIKRNTISSKQMIHIECIWKHMTERGNLIKEFCAFPTSMCSRLAELEKHRETIDFACKALCNFEYRFTSDIMKSIALIYLGGYVRALELLTELYKKQKKLFGGDDSLDTANQIGLAHLKLGNYDKALKSLMCETVETRGTIFCNQIPETLYLKHNIALVLHDKGNYKKVTEFYDKVLEVRERVMGKEEPWTLITKQNFAVFKLRQGNNKDALMMFQEVLEVRERILEVDHPSTLSTKFWIAETYGFLDRKDEAVELFKEVLEKREEILGLEHPQTVATKHNLAVVRFRQGEYKDALKLFQEVLEVEERVLGVNNADTLITKKWIADTYKFLGRN